MSTKRSPLTIKVIATGITVRPAKKKGKGEPEGEEVVPSERGEKTRWGAATTADGIEKKGDRTLFLKKKKKKIWGELRGDLLGGT